MLRRGASVVTVPDLDQDAPTVRGAPQAHARPSRHPAAGGKGGSPVECRRPPDLMCKTVQSRMLSLDKLCKLAFVMSLTEGKSVPGKRQTPTVRLRRLAAELRSLRAASGLTREEVVEQ